MHVSSLSLCPRMAYKFRTIQYFPKIKLQGSTNHIRKSICRSWFFLSPSLVVLSSLFPRMRVLVLSFIDFRNLPRASLSQRPSSPLLSGSRPTISLVHSQFELPLRNSIFVATFRSAAAAADAKCPVTPTQEQIK